MVLFVDLDNAVFLVVVGAGGQETGRGGLVGFQDAGFDGRGFQTSSSPFRQGGFPF